MTFLTFVKNSPVALQKDCVHLNVSPDHRALWPSTPAVMGAYHLNSGRQKYGLPGGSEVKTSACNVGDLGSIPGLGRSPGEGNGNPFGFPVAQPKRLCLQCGSCRRCGFDPWAGKIPWGRKRPPTPVFLPAESHGRRSLVGSSPWGRRVGHA